MSKHEYITQLHLNDEDKGRKENKSDEPKSNSRRNFLKAAAVSGLGVSAFSHDVLAQNSETKPLTNEQVIPSLEVKLIIKGEVISVKLKDIKIPKWQDDSEGVFLEAVTAYLMEKGVQIPSASEDSSTEYSDIKISVGRPKDLSPNSGFTKEGIGRSARKTSEVVLLELGRAAADVIVGSIPNPRVNGRRIRTGTAVSRGTSGVRGAISQRSAKKRRDSQDALNNRNLHLYNVPFMINDPDKGEINNFVNILINVQEDGYLDGYLKTNYGQVFLGSLKHPGTINRLDLEASSRTFAEIHAVSNLGVVKKAMQNNTEQTQQRSAHRPVIDNSQKPRKVRPRN